VTFYGETEERIRCGEIMHVDAVFGRPAPGSSRGSDERDRVVRFGDAGE
jgi:hypothetical protein